MGLAGRGMVSAMALGSGEDYLAGVGLKTDQAMLFGLAVPHNTPWNFNTFAELEIPAGASTVHSDLVLERGLAQTVRIVDPDGHPLVRARTQHHMRMSNWSAPLSTPEFQIKGLRRGEQRRVLARHEERKLCGWLHIVAGEQEITTLKLQPWAAVVGRLVEDDGMPRENVDLVPDHDADRRIVTDSTGHFRVEGLIPGIPLDVWVSSKPKFLSGKLVKQLVLGLVRSRTSAM